jgi:hypothetical protein
MSMASIGVVVQRLVAAVDDAGGRVEFGHIASMRTGV